MSRNLSEDDPPYAAERTDAASAKQHAGVLAPGLHVAATPIGNLGDVSPRVRRVLGAADLLFCEDTRRTRHLLAALGLDTGPRRLVSFHGHNEAAVLPRLLDRLAAGAAVGLVSDAGMPGVSDPGRIAVAAAREAGFAVHVVPGPSAALTALTASGLPSDRFHFLGFPPRAKGARRAAAESAARIPATLILFEAPTRLAAMLADFAESMGDRPAAVCRELTKLHEDVRTGSLSELAADAAACGPFRGEIAVVIGPPSGDAAVYEEEAPPDLDAELTAALATLSVRDAATQVARKRREVYARALELAAEEG